VNPPADAALGYATWGWAVFPLHTILAGRCSCRRPACAHPAKHPVTRHGLLEATTDPARVRGWWGRWPWANIGVVTGAVSGLVVLDVDPAKGGAESLARLQSLMGSLPSTLTAATGGGGWHLFFAHPSVEVRNTAGRLPGVAEPLPGLDLRGDGGYVVAAPSRHVSGGVYRWDGDGAVLAACPGWLRAAPSRVFPTGGSARVAPERGGSRYGLAALRAELVGVRAAAVGDRNNRLNRAAFCLGMLTAGGELDGSLVEDELVAAATDVGLGETEARASIRSGLIAGAREPRHRPLSTPATRRTHVASDHRPPLTSRSR
jgi:hypothetical protein